MTERPLPTEPFAQNPRLAEVVHERGFMVEHLMELLA